MPKVTVSLTPYWKEFLDSIVKSGVYGSRSELIRTALILWYDTIFFKSKGLQDLTVRDG